jgi:outer membrane protein
MKNTPTALAACALCLAAGHASAADPSPWTVRLGPAHVGFSTKADVSVGGNPVPGGDASASSSTTLGIELAYDVSDRLTARFLAGIPPETTLTGQGTLASAGRLGKVTYAPAVLSLTYKLVNDGPVRPYVGAGINYTIVTRNRDAFITDLDTRSAWGSVLQAGVEIPVNADWSVSLDARKIFLKTKATGTLPAFGGAPTRADVRLNPLVVFLSVGRRF